MAERDRERKMEEYREWREEIGTDDPIGEIGREREREREWEREKNCDRWDPKFEGIKLKRIKISTIWFFAQPSHRFQQPPAIYFNSIQLTRFSKKELKSFFSIESNLVPVKGSSGSFVISDSTFLLKKRLKTFWSRKNLVLNGMNWL